MKVTKENDTERLQKQNTSVSSHLFDAGDQYMTANTSMAYTSKQNTSVAAKDKGLESDAIAVIEIDVMFPGDAVNPEAFFEMLLNGRSARCEVPEYRYNIDAFYHPDSARGGTVRFILLLHIEGY